MIKSEKAKRYNRLKEKGNRQELPSDELAKAVLYLKHGAKAAREFEQGAYLDLGV